ncbi:MAG: aspartate--tRNA ligase [Bdellovibrionota bacterium]
MRRVRTHTCGELTAKAEGQAVTLMGWAHKRRDHGGVVFVDLRDRYGLTQIVVDPSFPEAHQEAEKIRNEFVLLAKGKVRRRPEGMTNAKLPTGEIEVYIDHLEILSEAKPLPFPVDEGSDVSETLRLKYRYLDLRRPNLQRNMIVRHKAATVVRNYLDQNDFLEIETPILYKSTPEGARDFIVPSRVNPGTFYALPQSPQTLKQLLMVSGFDRYYQIARCFRDEDLRADRQPEFSQIDIEMSFVDQEVIFPIFEGMMKEVFKSILGLDIAAPFERMDYDVAMRDYGVDKPDTRFGLKLVELSDVFKASEFNVFKQTLQGGGMIKGLPVPGATELFSRKDMDEYTKYVATYGAKGLLWFKWAQDGSVSGPAVKFLKPDELESLKSKASLKAGDVLFVVADQAKVANDALGSLRLVVGEKLGLIDKKKFNFLWVTSFPLLQYESSDGRWYACHHPFTAPVPEDVEKLIQGKNLGSIKAAAYDLVLNGVEVAGGSLRIYNQNVQAAMFRALGISEEEAKAKFGFFLEGLQYGTPPHGGLAFGMDRLVMILCGTDAIREVMAFPKTQKGQCLMSESPSVVTPEQLAELHIGLRLPKKLADAAAATNK